MSGIGMDLDFDVGYSLISDGCVLCPRDAAGKYPALKTVERHGMTCYVCPNGHGSFGEVPIISEDSGVER